VMQVLRHMVLCTLIFWGFDCLFVFGKLLALVIASAVHGVMFIVTIFICTPIVSRSTNSTLAPLVKYRTATLVRRHTVR
jgi:hypothetical protein